MSANPDVFYPGDRVEGTKHEYWRLRGRIAESQSLQGKRKVLVRWDGTEVDAAVPRASLKIIPEEAVEDENDDDEEREGGAESADSDSEEDNDGRGNDESEDDLSEEEVGDPESEGDSEGDDPPVASSTASIAVNSAKTLHLQVLMCPMNHLKLVPESEEVVAVVVEVVREATEGVTRPLHPRQVLLI